MRAVRPSHRSELAYRADLQQLVREMRVAGAGIAEDLRRHSVITRDGDSVAIADETVPGLSAAMHRAASRFGRIEEQAMNLAALAVRRSRADVDARLVSSIQESIGVNVAQQLVDSPALGRAMADATTANVALIKSMPEEFLAQVRDVVTTAWQKGLRWEEMAKAIAARGDVAENRAWTIARDQTSKMNAAFNKERQTGIGIEEYDWSGTLDIRERISHRRMEGVRCRWDSPPLIDGEHVHPGQAVLCRCVPRPVFHLDAVSGGGGLQREAA